MKRVAGGAGRTRNQQRSSLPVQLCRCSIGPVRALQGGGSAPGVAIAQRSVASSPRAESSSSKHDSAPDPAARAAEDTEAARDWEEELEELLKLISLLPPSVRTLVEEHPQMPQLLEVVMDLGRPPLARFPTGDVKLGNSSVTVEDLELAIAQVGDFGGDNRAGIDRTLHRISCIRNRGGKIIGLTCRVGRAIRGSARLVQDLVLSGASILFLGRPGVGKTTAIREVSRALADEIQKRVVIVDTSNEIGGDGDIPHEGIGRARRIQVPEPEAQHRVMIEAVENHMPEVVVIDEIGTEAECVAARTIAQRGVQLVATAHGNELENVIKNPSLADLVGGIQSVTLGDEEARKRGVQKSILERAGPPTFDVAVEMLERSKWRVHLDVAQAIDLLLAGGAPGGQVRERAADGSILKYNTDPAVSGSLARPARELNGSSSAATTLKAAKAAAKAALAAAEAAAAAAANTSSLPRGLGAGTGPASSPARTGTGASDSQDEEEGEEEEGTQQLVGTGSTNGFVKRSVLGSLEAEADAAEADMGDDGVPTQKGARRLASRQALIGIKSSDVVLRLFPYELDADKLWEVLSAMELTHKVLIVRRVAQADAVLGLRTRVKSDAALRQAAKAVRVPIYAIKATGTANLVRALRTLLGVDPAAGGMFVRSSSSSTSVSSAEPLVEDAAGQPAASGPLRAEMDIAAVREATQTSSSPTSSSAGAGPAARHSSTYRAGLAAEALEEARLACEQLVGPLRQPVELMPRAQAIIEEQIKLVDEYSLDYEVVGAPDARLRVLPRPL